MKRIAPIALLAVLLLVMCAHSEEGETPTESAAVDTTAEPAHVDFETPVVQLLARSCTGCHGAEGGAAGLSLMEKAVVGGSLAVASSQLDTLHIVYPGHPETSYLIMKVSGAEGIEGKRMPLKGDGLSPEEIAALEAWIAALCTPEEKAAAEMKAKKEAVKEKGEEAAKEMKAKKEAVKEKGEEAAKEMKAKKEAVKEKGEEAAEEAQAEKADAEAEEAAEEAVEEDAGEEEAETPAAEEE